MEQLLLTIDLVHIKKIIHRDIKLENILIHKVDEANNYDIRVGDFGLAIFSQEECKDRITEVFGTPCYIAPEILRQKSYSEKADLFSIGSVFFNLLTGRYLFNGNSIADLLSKNKRCETSNLGRYLVEEKSALSLDLLLKLLSDDPSHRCSAVEAIDHQLFREDSAALGTLLEYNRSLA